MKTKRVLSLILAVCMLICMFPAIGVSAADDVIGLKDAFKGYFKIGTALSGGEFSKAEVQELTLKHFNSVTCENEMKPDSTLDQAACQSVGNNVNTQVKLSTDARRILAFCEENHIPMRGHVIAWHSQTPGWFFRENFNNNGNYVTPEIMNQRLESFIKNLFELIATDYPDLEIYAWDMCNEAFTDSNPANMRSSNESNWIRVYGDNTFIYKAFEYGQKYKPEGCMLCYNDYNEYDDGKLAAISALCKDLYEKGLLDAIGMQSHLTVGNPTIEKYRKALDTYASIGCPIMITELDVQARNGNTAEQIEYYTELFETYGDYKDSIEAVVFWGTQDSASWRPNGNPLLFANGYQPKDVFYAVVDTAADHEHVWREEVTPPTCTEKGYTTKICTVEGCDRTTTGSYVDALGHRWDDGKVTKPATTEEKGVMTYTCTVCGETKTKSIQRVGAKVPDSIDFTDPACLDDIEIVNKTSAAVKEGQGLYLVSTAEAFEPANGQLNGDAAANPKDLVLVPAEGDWVATMKFAFNQGGSQGYYEFFGFYAYDDANNCVGIRGGDGAMQDFIRKDGTITAETRNYSSGLKSGSLFWYRIEKEADNYTCSISTDGETFTEMFKFENTGIEGETIAIDAYSGMATGYNYTIESLVFEEGDGPVQPVCEHDYEAVVTEPTCTEKGKTVYTCSKCGDSYEEEIAALGHDYVDYKCSRCGAEDPGKPVEPPVPECPSAKFTDVPGEDNWAHAGIDYCVANDLMNGVSDTVFNPAGNVTRAQLVTILYRAAEDPEIKKDSVIDFDDVEDGLWYSDAIAWASSNGIVNGVSDGKFAPMNPVSREQIATILYRYAGSPDVAGTLNRFPDNGSAHPYAVDALVWATRCSLINGIKSGDVTNLAPLSYATRAQIASIIMRFLENPEHELTTFIGISMPTKDLQRWNQDGARIAAMLNEAGYEVDLEFAANDPSIQISQISNMIANGASVIIVSAIDGDALGTVLAHAKEAGIPVIAYDRLIMGSDAITYYTTFDNYLVGVLQGQYIEQELDLAKAGDKTYNIEFVTGDPGDNNINFFFDGAMSVLQKYLDSGVLVCQSGQTKKYDVATEDWDSAKAQERFENILSTYYADKQLDAVMASNDSTAQGVAIALATSYSNDVYPIITGQDCDIVSTMNIMDGKQAMSVFKDTRDLAAKAVEFCLSIVEGTEPPINDTETYDNGTGIIPAYLCAPKVCTIDNFREILIDSGYYTEEDLVR